MPRFFESISSGIIINTPMIDKEVLIGFLDLSKKNRLSEFDLDSIKKQFSKNELAVFKNLHLKRKNEVLVGRHLAKKLLFEKFKLLPEEIKIGLDLKKKPTILYLPNNQQSSSATFFCNLSHTNNLIGCAVANFEIGFDLEEARLRKMMDKICRRLFDPRELDFYLNSRCSNRLQIFYRFWTLKEAYLKQKSSKIWNIKKAPTFRLNKISSRIPSNSQYINLKFKDKRYNHEVLGKGFYIGSIASTKLCKIKLSNIFDGASEVEFGSSEII